VAHDNRTVHVYLVAAGQYHDIDFARIELLKLLAENPRIRVHVATNYHDIDAINQCDFLITYTCNLVPDEDEQIALRDYIASGKRWFALHGTNAILEFLKNGRVNSPETAPILMETLGTQFISHPPIEPYQVQISDPGHELVAGIEPFETDDELYLCRIHGDLQMLLHARFTGSATSGSWGYIEDQWEDDADRPVYYINRVGDGEVLYLTLGHCRGHYDMQPMIEFYPNIERGSWALDVFYDLLRRGINYCAERAL
jgi:hypothetical protein